MFPLHQALMQVQGLLYYVTIMMKFSAIKPVMELYCFSLNLTKDVLGGLNGIKTN